MTAAPGRERIAFDALVVTPDDFGRLRFVLAERDGYTPFAEYRQLYRALRRAWPERPGYEGLWGEVSVVVPERHRKFYFDKVAALRNRWARAEVTVRRHGHGVSLDLFELTPL